MSEAVLTIDGETRNVLSLTREQLAALPAEARIEDVSRIDARRQGEAIRLSALLELADPTPAASHLTLHSADGFSASIPLELTSDSGVIIFQSEGQSLPESHGGPFRYLTPNAAECKTAEVDACSNVKSLVRIELTDGQGRDTRDTK